MIEALLTENIHENSKLYENQYKTLTYYFLSILNELINKVYHKLLM